MTETKLVDLWNRCLVIIKDNVSEETYRTWFVPIKPLRYAEKENQITVQVPSPFFYEFLEEHYIDLLIDTIRKYYGEGTNLMYEVVVDNSVKKKGVITEQSTNKTVLLSEKSESNGNKAPNILKTLDSHLIPQYTFNSFIEGYSNKLPRSVAEEVAKKPAGTAFNPLFVYGPSGVGKTHLVNAIGLKIRELYPELRVLYISAHLFQVQYVDSVRNNTTNDFIMFYQTIDVLIIDDVQELAGSEKTQNTFFYIFNHLRQNHKQLILTADRSPILLQGINERLMTRFKWGMIAELEKPSIELRKSILRNKIFRDGLQFPDEVVNYIAENVTESVRELEGVIISLMAHSTVYNRNIDLSLTKQIVQKVVKYERRTIKVDDIIKAVCGHFGIEVNAIYAKTRKSEVVQARQIAMFLAKKYTDCSVSKIGQLIGNKNHATVIYAFRAVQGQYDVNKIFRSDVEGIEKVLESKAN